MSAAVSVIVPTYGHRDFVLAALDSVFAQTWRDMEVIVVNDGSPDDTAAVLRPLVEAGRIRYLEQPNQGQGAARNRGLAEATGEFVAYLDDDDLWPPDKLQWQIEMLRRHPSAVLTYGGFARLMPNGRLIPDDKTGFPSGDVYRTFRLRNWIHSPGQTLIRRAALNAAGGFDPAIWGADDWDLYVRLARLGSFQYAPRIALHYRIHAANASRRAVFHALNDLKVLRKHGGWNLPLMVRHVLLAGDYYAPSLLKAAEDATKDRKAADAWQACAMALLFKPTLLGRPRSLRRIARCLTGRSPAANVV